MRNIGQAICIWCGALGFAIFLATPFFDGFLIPMTPTLDAASVVAFYQAHLEGIRIGAILLLVSPSLLIAFSTAISADIKRMNGVGPALVWFQILISVLTWVPFVATSICWDTAAFRLERAPEITQALNDLGWLCYVMPGAPGGFMPLGIALAIFTDKSPVLVYPRWAGYFNVVVSIAFFMGCSAGLTKVGPFAWNGLFAYTVPTVLFVIWLVIMTILLLRNNRQQTT